MAWPQACTCCCVDPFVERHAGISHELHMPRLNAGRLNAGIVASAQARVVLLGHGADELCAGYGRHRTRFKAEVRLLVARFRSIAQAPVAMCYAPYPCLCNNSVSCRHILWMHHAKAPCYPDAGVMLTA